MYSFVLNPVRIFGGCFGGATLYQNPRYISPNVVRAQALTAKHGRYAGRVIDKKTRERYEAENTQPEDPFKDVFK